MTLPLRPKRGGFLRPFRCGLFIRDFLLGLGPHGSPKIKPEIGTYQAYIFKQYKLALMRATAEDKAIRTEEKRARKENRRIDPDNIEALIEEYLSRMTYKANGCRYCSYFHARQALKSGLTPEEISQLLSGDVDNCPEEEAVAVIYAQHWAESDAHPDAEAVQKLQQTYGVEKTEFIHLMLRMIRLGNLLGNSWDYLLYRISFGKWRG
jgi:hypothetical protein